MFTHNFDPVLFDIGFISIRWYSLSYIFGILFGWWYGKTIISKNFLSSHSVISKGLDDLITYLIVAILIGGRAGYVIFYNFDYFLINPLEIFKIWNGGMSFHGALIGVVVSTYLFSLKRNLDPLIFLDIIACVSPIGIFLGRLANFINGELVGKITTVPWSVIFPSKDLYPRHPSQIYEALLEGLLIFIILNIIINKKNYKTGICSYLFLIIYGIFRIISEIFREPDIQIGYFFNFISMGMILSFMMILTGLIIFIILKKKNEI